MVTPIIPKDLARGKTDIIITIVAKLFDIKEIIGLVALLNGLVHQDIEEIREVNARKNITR